MLLLKKRRTSSEPKVPWCAHLATSSWTNAVRNLLLVLEDEKKGAICSRLGRRKFEKDIPFLGVVHPEKRRITDLALGSTIRYENRCYSFGKYTTFYSTACEAEKSSSFVISARFLNGKHCIGLFW
jgi:hypothetical protein